jgi:hypothetical protein
MPRSEPGVCGVTRPYSGPQWRPSAFFAYVQPRIAKTPPRSPEGDRDLRRLWYWGVTGLQRDPAARLRPRQPAPRYAASNLDVQCGQRVASIGMLDRQ